VKLFFCVSAADCVCTCNNRSQATIESESAWKTLISGASRPNVIKAVAVELGNWCRIRSRCKERRGEVVYSQ
jgi:hypothetical protein